MSKKLILSKECIDARLPRIGGGALLPQSVWPTAPDGTQLTLIASIPASFLNTHADFNLPENQYLSVFSYYSPSEYFLDNITYHGSAEELEWLRKGYTRVLMHSDQGSAHGAITIPAICIDIDKSENANADNFGGSKVAAPPTLLQNKALVLKDEKFAVQFYAADFPEPFKGIFGLSDAVGYLYIDENAPPGDGASDAGTFFIQVT
ncbi:hypothetical protein B0920_21275 [Massilia sp. KIM]|uniref:DUF1963 domain-containing protein n=1 Tax=Massilia sp. KIM TaxID=1955422 RepID=UPI0009CD9C59|nr:DUF1963 domain-containing protein [Massilia sp. KIM]OON59815.1 hypothetical protein B0920_21275 [Massilia sp. KIM]